MASEDVIELGSSDEEAKPAPKKAKPRPNAMVHIPNKLSGVTVKPTKNINPINKLIGKGLIVKKLNAANQKPHSSRNGKGTSNSVTIKPQIINPSLPLKPPIRVQSVAPIGRNFPVNFVKGNSRPMLHKSVQQDFLKQSVKISCVKSLSNLPPSVTITRTAGSKRPAATSISSNKKKRMKVTPIRDTVTTVELDDDEVPTTSTAGNPQWYIRPEEQCSINDLEEKNNAEPDANKLIEITIEDSPAKPIQNKRTNEINAELAITIDDSPVKSTPAKETSVGSDGEEKEVEDKVPHSKKKLNYPKEAEPEQRNTIEIEIEPIGTESYPESMSISMVIEEENVRNDNIVEVIESPVKNMQTPPSTPKKDVKSKSKSFELGESSTQSEEFHPVYQEFIDLCFSLENSSDMKIIVEKKIKAYYRQVPKTYTESEEFIDIVSSKIMAMKAGPEKLYLYIKDIVDELNLQRKMAKAKPAVKDTREIEAEKFQYGEDSEFDSKRQRQIRKLEKTLKKLHRAIQKLEEQEVDFDDEEDSVYLLTESDDSSSSIKDLDKELKRDRSILLQRYKERMVRVHAKFCQLTNTKMPSEPRIHIEPRPGHPAGPAKRLEKWINKKVPIGKPLPFPDFHDVLHCVKEANEQDKLGWNDVDIMEEARDLFTRCGKKLQRRRQENEWRLAASRIVAEVDPAQDDQELKQKLEMNKQLASKKETDVFNKYADKQSQLNLEPVEIGDKEAEESPVESEDEEAPEEKLETLENKEKRKERLRRLIQEKSKKDVEAKENKPKELMSSQSSVEITDVKDSKHSQDLSESKENMEVDTVTKDVIEETMEIDTDSQDANIEAKDAPSTKERTQSISDHSKVDSDIDELHLLQKLHSDEMNTSTVDSSDTDSPVNISDTLQSSSDKGKPSSDVISIENSSYSESEHKDDNAMKDIEMVNIDTEAARKIDSDKISSEIECSSARIQVNKTNNEEYNESVESILLASSDDEDNKGTNENPTSNDAAVNLQDDTISIGDAVILEVETNKDNSETSQNNNENVPVSEEVEANDNKSVGSTVIKSSCKKRDDSEDCVTKSESSPKQENLLDNKNCKSKEKHTDICSGIEETIKPDVLLLENELSMDNTVHDAEDDKINNIGSNESDKQMDKDTNTLESVDNTKVKLLREDHTAAELGVSKDDETDGKTISCNENEVEPEKPNVTDGKTTSCNENEVEPEKPNVTDGKTTSCNENEVEPEKPNVTDGKTTSCNENEVEPEKPNVINECHIQVKNLSSESFETNASTNHTKDAIQDSNDEIKDNTEKSESLETMLKEFQSDLALD